MAAATAVANSCLRPDLDLMMSPRRRTRYVLVGAASESQAVEFVRVAATLVEESELLRDLAEVRSDRIEFRIPRVGPKGERWTARTCIRAMSSSSRSTRGMSASLLVLDEFGHVGDSLGPGGDTQLYAALLPSLRAFGAKAKTLIISTPSGRSGKFFELFEAAQGGVLPSARAVQASVTDVVPDIDRGWLDARRAELGQSLYAQEFEAQFTDAGGSFFDLSDVEFLDAPVAPEDGTHWIGCCDAAFHGDSFGAVVLGRSRQQPGTLVVGACGAIKPKGVARSFTARRSREDATLEEVRRLFEPYGVTQVVGDQHGATPIRSYFGRFGVGMRVVNLSRQTQTQAFVSLRSRLTDGSLQCWRHAGLIDELRRVQARADAISPSLRGQSLRHGCSFGDRLLDDEKCQ